MSRLGWINKIMMSEAVGLDCQSKSCVTLPTGIVKEMAHDDTSLDYWITKGSDG